MRRLPSAADKLEAALVVLALSLLTIGALAGFVVGRLVEAQEIAR
jgi:hypothetical protein